MKTSIIGLISLQIGTPITSKSDSAHSTSILKDQLDCNNIDNEFPDQTHQNFHSLTRVESQESNDVLNHHQVMKADDVDDFKEAIEKEMSSFK